MQADHTRDAREAEYELTQAAQVSCQALLAEVRLDVAGMLVPVACTMFSRRIRACCFVTHSATGCESAVT